MSGVAERIKYRLLLWRFVSKSGVYGLVKSPIMQYTSIKSLTER